MVGSVMISSAWSGTCPLHWTLATVHFGPPREPILGAGPCAKPHPFGKPSTRYFTRFPCDLGQTLQCRPGRDAELRLHDFLIGVVICLLNIVAILLSPDISSTSLCSLCVSTCIGGIQIGSASGVGGQTRSSVSCCGSWSRLRRTSPCSRVWTTAGLC